MTRPGVFHLFGGLAALGGRLARRIKPRASPAGGQRSLGGDRRGLTDPTTWECTLRTRVIVLLLYAVLMHALIPATPVVAADSRCWEPRFRESRFARRINAAREAHGVGKLRLDPELSKAARVHTREMVGTNQLHHTASSVLRSRVTNWAVLGENVGVGGKVGSLHRAFMTSPSHRDNILYGTYKHVGVGTMRRGGRLWVTVLFEAVTNPGTTLRMPSC